MGGTLWQMLLEVLRPQIVVLSVARKHLRRIEFEPMTEWETVREFKRTHGGALRRRPYEVVARWYDVGGERSLFVFGQAAQTPFGLLSDTGKRETGAIAQDNFRDGR